MDRMFLTITILLASTLAFSATDHEPPSPAPMKVERMRCEYLENPVGIDVRAPRLSWIVTSEERGQRQTAYRVLVASSPSLLRGGTGDLWDSGRVESDETAQIEYHGRPLESRQTCYWKVMGWDRDGKATGWSGVATWSMGLLERSDWDAAWITLRDPLRPAPVEPAYGYLSWRADSANVEKHLVLDLGREYRIDSLQLWPAGGISQADGPGFYTYGWTPKVDGFLFPVRFQVEVAANESFSNGQTVVDESDTDFPSPGLRVSSYKFPPVAARYIRLTVNKLAARDPSNFAFALSELMVFSEGRNVGKAARVYATDAVDARGWSMQHVVDGHGPSRNSTLDVTTKPVLRVRKEFGLPAAVTKAVVSVTGLGTYELRINGKRVGEQLLAPEWTRFSERIQYQTYDVTGLLDKGANAVGAQLAGGWWTGPMALESALTNPEYCLLMRLDMELADGTNVTIVTDPSWIASEDGPIRRAGIYYGEQYDGTCEQAGWDMPGFSGNGWLPVSILSHPENAQHAELVAQPNEPIRVMSEITPIAVTEPSPGVFVFDMGQNMVGWCKLTVDAARGQKITLRHAEMLRDDGNIYTENLRGAAQVNEYTWPGGTVTQEPHFTYHGFRYVELTGFEGIPDDVELIGQVIHSASPDAGRFESSVELVNEIMHAVEWVQRGNLHSAPTDCPQRSERFGWLGDMQAFAQTSMYNMDMSAFLTKWVADIRDSQLEDGRFPNIAPHPSDDEWLKWYNAEYGPAWSDAGIIIPWLAYLNYGDKRILEQQYDASVRWIQYVHEHNPDLIWRNSRGGDYGDWINGSMTGLEGYPRESSEVDKVLFATAFFAHSTDLLSKMASVLGYRDDAAKYAALYSEIKSRFNQEFVAADGRIKGDTQAGYALVLNLDLVAGALRPNIIGYFLEALATYKGHLSTGMQTTHRMMLELTRNGHHKEAWRLVNLRTAPSWGHMVEMGATTIWERWDGYRGDGTFQSPNMNSFNHMAFGSVGEWVWKSLVGINLDTENPGYRHFVIKPGPVGEPIWVKGELETIRGTIVSDWEQTGNKFTLRVEIPANTTATLHIPARDIAIVKEGGRIISGSADITFVTMRDGYAVVEVGSGQYVFESSL